MMKTIKTRVFCSLLLLFFALEAFALSQPLSAKGAMNDTKVIVLDRQLVSASTQTQNSTSPTQLLAKISEHMLEKLNRNQATLKTKPKVVYGIVNRLLLPYVDTRSMARSVLGPTLWRQATSMQRQKFTEAFVTLVVRTYAAALAEYTNETINFLPLRDNPASDRVIVDSHIIRRGAPAIPVSYRMRKVGSAWRIYDIAVEGISLVRSYRSQFANKVRHNGLDSLIKELQMHNERAR